MKTPALIICPWVFLVLGAQSVWASDETAPATAEEQVAQPGMGWVPAVSGNVFYFNRRRLRYDVIEERFRDNLNHQTLQGSLDMVTPFYGDAIGIDLGVFYTVDLANKASPDHEMSFFPWDNPWEPDWSKRDARSGTSIYRANLKLQHAWDGQQAWGRIGYFQPSGPGVIGVNWSLMPGTYRGVETGFESGSYNVAFALADQYKAPWFSETYHFRRNDGQTDVEYLWSLGARYRASSGFSAEVAYGESHQFLRSAHLKFKYNSHDGKFYLSYQLYGMGDRGKSGSADNQYDGHLAHQHYVAAAWRPSAYVLKAEFLHTRAPSNGPEHAGYFAYRLIGRYGGANGAYEPWWDNRSDWNHNRESAFFLSASRSLDFLGVSGATFGLSGAYGFGGNVYGAQERLRERAWSVDLGYAITRGPLKDARASLHYTRYDNRTKQPSWGWSDRGYKNLFQDERDLKLLLVIPWQIH